MRDYLQMTNKILNNNISTISEEDFIDNILYLIYKVSDDPKYSVISELIYILGKDSLFKLCSILGGCEIKIPTLLELRLFTGALYIYYATKYDGLSFDTAFNNLNLPQNLKKDIVALYKEISTIEQL